MCLVLVNKSCFGSNLGDVVSLLSIFKIATVRSRLVTIMDLTRCVLGWRAGQSGSGDCVRDVSASVFGLWVELVWCLGYPATRLNRTLRGLGLRNSMWCRVSIDANVVGLLLKEWKEFKRLQLGGM